MLPRLLRAYDTEPVELLLALAALSRGAWLAAPWWDTMASPLYAPMRHLPEGVWAGLFLAAGAIQAWGLWTAHPLLRVLGATAITGGHVHLVAIFALAAPDTMGVPNAAAIALFGLWAMIRIPTGGSGERDPVAGAVLGRGCPDYGAGDAGGPLSAPPAAGEEERQ